MTTDYTDYKVLPFTGAQGHVPGHEIRSFGRYGSAATYVVFSRFDPIAEMPIEVVVHWTRWTQYTKKHWPNSGSVCAVIMQDGSRHSAEAMYTRHSTASYEAAPIVARDCFQIRHLCAEDVFLEVVGVSEYMRNGTPIVDPWERDNAEYRARFDKVAV